MDGHNSISEYSAQKNVCNRIATVSHQELSKASEPHVPEPPRIPACQNIDRRVASRRRSSSILQPPEPREIRADVMDLQIQMLAIVLSLFLWHHDCTCGVRRSRLCATTYTNSANGANLF